MNETDESASIALQLFEPTAEDVYSIETVVHLTQTPRHRIAVYCRHGLISPVKAPEREGWWFDHEAIRALRQMEDLRVDFGLNLAGLCVLSELLREVERLREEVRALHRV
jgi:DNA-binding transcriptional MerR regulator